MPNDSSMAGTVLTEFSCLLRRNMACYMVHQENKEGGARTIHGASWRRSDSSSYMCSGSVTVCKFVGNYQRVETWQKYQSV